MTAARHVRHATSRDRLAVVVVADGMARLAELRALLSVPGFGVVSECTRAADAAHAVERHRPAVVLLDLALDAGGLDCIERVMAGRATPIVLCGAAATRGTADAGLAAGAVDSLGALDVPERSPAYGIALRHRLVVASRVRVITHPRARLRSRALGSALSSSPEVPSSGALVAVIGASTGGPPALGRILRELSADLAVPIVVVQHMAAGFVEGMVGWLDTMTALPVVIAEHGQRLAAGTVHLAPASNNLVLRPGLRIELTPTAKGQFFTPGIDVTMRSAADVCGARAVGVLLTGMGRDGAEGLRAVRDRGGWTIGQDESTSAVWGMPAAAAALDAVCEQLPLDGIAAALLAAVRGSVRAVGSGVSAASRQSAM